MPGCDTEKSEVFQGFITNEIMNADHKDEQYDVCIELKSYFHHMKIKGQHCILRGILGKLGTH